MSDDLADLSQLADIATPAPVSFLPPAPGWLIIAAALLAAAAILGAAALRRHRRDAYRREALKELAAIGRVSDAASAAAVSAILKRAALVAYPRARSASLTGAAWLAFLDRTGGMRDFEEGRASALASAAFGAPVLDGDAIAAAAAHWVKRHGREA